MGNRIQSPGAPHTATPDSAPDSVVPIPTPSFDNLIELLETRAIRDDAQASRWVWLDDRGREVQSVSTAEIRIRAITIARTILDAGAKPGDCVMMVLPPSLDAMFAFWGCIYAGVIAVPVAPPDPNQALRDLPTFKAKVSHCKAKLALSNKYYLRAKWLVGIKESLSWFRPGTESWPTLDWIDVESLDFSSPEDQLSEYQPPKATRDTPAFIQYSSGSTGSPKGAIITHYNLLWQAYVLCNHQPTPSRVVSWAPHWHDLGFNLNFMCPLYTLGNLTVLFSPLDFLKSPLLWLRTISTYRANVSVNPTFAYSLVTAKITDSELSQLDLSTCTFYMGAEPMNPLVIQRFVDRFKSAGVTKEKLIGTYGLAENTLSATIDEYGVGTFNLCVDSNELELNGIAVVCDEVDHPGVRKFASSGVPVPGTQIFIVNAETRDILPDRRVGEIWISSPCVAKGYLHDPDLTAAVFEVKPASPSGAASSSERYLATGDKGFVHDGRLYVVGRLKDLLIVNGRNIAPQDIEFFVQEHFHQLRPGCQIAVQVVASAPSATSEALVFISEIRDTEVDALRSNERKAAELALAIRSAILRQFQVEAHSIALVEPRTIPKTTSGKVRRNDAGKLWRGDGLRKVYQAVFDSPASKPSVSRPGRRSILTQGVAESPVSPRLRKAAALVQPNTTTEEVVLELVCDVFGFTEAISGTEDLFDVGLDSIRLTQLISRMEGRFPNVSWNDALTMESISVKTIAEFIDSASGDTTRGKRGRFPIPLPECDKRSRAGSLLSFGQERLLLVHRKLGASCSYNVPVALKIRSTRSKIDERFLVECMNKIIRRHKILTTPYPKEQSENKFAFPAAPPSVAIMTPTSRDPTDAMHEVIDSLNTAARTPFNLETGPLIRVIVYLLSSTEVVLFVNIHHIATDGWSMGVILRDLGALIAGEQLKPLDLQFDDYAFFERANLASKDVWNQKLGFWKNEVSGLHALNWLPRNYLGARERSEEGRVFTFSLEADLIARLSALAQSARTTLYVVLLASFQLVMHRYSQQEDIFVVSPFANRRYRNVEDLVGYFINTLILRANFADAADLPFKQLLQRVKENVGRVSAHQDFPVELAAAPSKGLDHPLFRTLFSLRNFPFSLDVPGYSVEQMFDIHTSAAMYEFALELQPATDGSFVGMVQYSADLFSAATIEQWHDHFHATLESVCENPNLEVSRVNIFSPQENRQLLSFSCVSSKDEELKPVPGSDEKIDAQSGIVEPERYTIHELFSRRAKKIPQQLASVCPNEKVTYGELDALTTALADHFVRTSFVASGENPVVAVVLPRGTMLLQAYLALMKAGAAYMPILVTHSDQWVSDLLHQSGSMHVVCSEEHLPRFKTIASQVNSKIAVVALEEAIRCVSATQHPSSFQPARDPNNLIYVIYTSGSTGTPKGVLVPQKGVATTMFYHGRRLGVGPNDRQLQFFSPQFDGAASEMWLPLIHGATVVFPPEETVKVGRELIDYMNDQQITFIMVLPNVLRLLRLNPVQSLRIIQVCGEACPADIVSEFREQNWDVRIFNAYGPTEASICNAIGELRSPVMSGEPLETAPIGRPLPGTTAYIVDKYMQLIPLGLIGELLIGGSTLARGYHNMPSQTKDRFIDVPQLGRVFRTGDVARFLPDGRIQIMGRVDDQVKVNGYRIEVGQIEQTLLKVSKDTITQVAVIAWKRQGNAVIAAFVVPPTGQTADIASLTALLQAELPPYLMPSKIIALRELPLTQNGKLDKKKLEQLAESRNRLALPGSRTRRPSVSEIKAPEGPTEVALASIWCKLLGVDFVARASNFFDLGGSSISLMLEQQAVLEKFAVAVPIELFYKCPTLRELAKSIEDIVASGSSGLQLFRTDLEREGVLPGDIEPSLATAAPLVAEEKRHIFITGATGLFGAHLLYELFQQCPSEARFYCLLRAENVAAGMKRISSNMQKYGIWKPEFETRIIPVIGALGLSQLGLPTDKWNELARGVDTIYHSGAMVSFVAPYSELKEPNVIGTQDVLRLASTFRMKQVHYVSTLSVFPTSHVGTIFESDTGDWRQLREGYVQSKWVAEQLVRSAILVGLPATIYRIGRIPYNAATGAIAEADTMVKWVQASIQTATTPEVDLMVDILPVDHTARMMAVLSLNSTSAGRTFHIVHPKPIPYKEAVNLIASRGYSVAFAEFEEWKKLIRAIAHMRQGEKTSASDKDAALIILGTLEQMKRSDFGPGVFSCEQTLASWPAGAELPEVVPAAKLFVRLLDLMENRDLIWEGLGMDSMEKYSTEVWPLERDLPWVPSHYAKRCIKCISSERRVSLDSNGVCAECIDFDKGTDSDIQETAEEHAALLKQFDFFMREEVVGKGDQYDALLLFSGGKDSTYMFHRLRQEYPDLRILAATISHEFLSEVAVENARRVVEKLDAEHLVVRPIRSVFKKNYAYALHNPIVGSVAVNCDNMDGNLTHDIGRTSAASMNIPVVISGVSKTQVDALFKCKSFLLPNEMLERDMLVPVEGLELRKVFSDAEYRYFMASRPKRTVPRIICPHYAWRVPEQEMKQQVQDLGLISKGKEGPIATNNLVLPVMIASDIARNGYCGFETEFALQVRQGRAERTFWLPLFEMLDYFCNTRRFANVEINNILKKLDLTRAQVGLEIRPSPE